VIKTGQHYYRAACELAWRWAQQSVPQDDAKATLAFANGGEGALMPMRR